MIEINTNKSVEVVDITSLVKKVLLESTFDSGICLIYTLHTTTGIIINEAETELIRDIIGTLGRMIPVGIGYKHDKIDSNAHAHLRAIIIGNCAVIPVENKRLILGTWQRILFLEFDGPRSRRIEIKFIGD
jgi:secondary thiamine-phosphate synthase enzyme